MINMFLRIVALLTLSVGFAHAEVKFTLTEISVPASTYLKPARVAEVTKNYTNREIGFADLQAMVSDLQGLYAEAGVPTAEVILPAQDIMNGVLRVELVEAEIERIDVTENPGTKASFFYENLSLQAGQKPDFAQLERDMIILSNSHGLAPTLDFSPGERAGGTIVTLKANEPAALNYSVGLDNYGREETGETRLNLGVQWASLTGWRDRLGMNATLSDGSWSAALNYDRPMGWQGGRATFGIYASNSQVIGGDFQAAKVISDGMGVSLGYRFPWYVEHDRSLYVALGLTHDQTEAEIASVQFVDTSLSEFTAEANWQRRLPLTSIGATGRLRFGSASSAGQALTDGGYAILQWSIWANRQLSQDWALSMNFNGQFANKVHIPVARQFGIGGTGILRGYPSDVRSSPDAFAVQAQLTKITPWTLYDQRIAVQPYAFIDAVVLATSAVVGQRTTDEDRLYSAGLGTNVTFDNRYTMTAFVAVPMRDTTGFDGSSEPVFLLGLNAVF